ncbi:MAG: hypothetical protein H6551_12535 [Chitinophagales bacterium]|nr:hypothetical protein [Chitinophagaceae bacterium]MCB9065958.1 hypothetical protein [Chitinophagales bacterium]
MWKKVTDIAQLQSLDTGDVLIKYPIDGKVAEVFDNANPENISPRVVGSNEDGVISLNFIYGSAHSDPILGMYNSGIMAPVIITYEEAIAQNVWWRFDEE